jgi:hypothetical protein
MVTQKFEHAAGPAEGASRPRKGAFRWFPVRRPGRRGLRKPRVDGAQQAVLLHDVGMGGTAASAANAVLATLAEARR